jgi:translation initiation factor IF-2
MSDSNDDKTTSVTGKKTFSLKRPSVEQGMVRQEMGRGRTKAVVVETRKRRINRPEDDKPVPPVTLKPRPAAAAEKPAEPAPAAKPAAGAASTPAAPSRAPAAKPAPRGAVLNQLSASEVEARRRALQDSRIRDVEERKRAEEEAARRAEEEARRAAEEAEAARIKAEEDARLAKEAAEQATAREDCPRSHHHHPGTRQAYGRTLGRRDQVPDEGRPDDEAGRRHRRRHWPN